MFKRSASVLLLAIASFMFMFSVSSSARAEEGDDRVPGVIKAGLAEYKANGAEAAVKAWIKGSVLENNKEALGQANMFNMVESIYGKYLSYQVITVKDVSRSYKLVFLEMDYERGPAFFKFMTYRAGDNWIVDSFTFNTELNKILPECFICELPDK